MTRWALFVDAGWLFAGGTTSAFGERLERKSIEWDPASLIHALVDEAEDLVPIGSDLLRTYWYDGSPNRLPVGKQNDVAMQRDVKLRLGRTAKDGQKGVDGLIIHDLITHAYRRTIDDAVVISGDEDLLDAIESAQANGTRVHLLEIPIGGIADGLLRSFDNRGRLDEEFWQEHLRRVEIPEEPAPAVVEEDQIIDLNAADHPVMPPPAIRPAWLDEPMPTTATESDTAVDTIAVGELVARAEDFADEWLRTATEEGRAELLASRPYLDKEIDVALLRAASEGHWLSQSERRILRDSFWERIADA